MVRAELAHLQRHKPDHAWVGGKRVADATVQSAPSSGMLHRGPPAAWAGDMGAAPNAGAGPGAGGYGLESTIHDTDSLYGGQSSVSLETTSLTGRSTCAARRHCRPSRVRH